MYLPLMLEMAGQPVLCIGGGPVALAKLTSFVEAGAAVTVIAPQVSTGVDPSVTVIERAFRAGDLSREPSPRIVVAATGSPAVDDEVAAEALDLGIWCLRVDGAGAQGHSDVAVPAVIRDRRLIIALTTGAPALSRHLRATLRGLVESGWGDAAAILAEARADAEVRAALEAVPTEERRRRWRAAVAALTDPQQASGRRHPDAAEVRAMLVDG